MKSFKKQLTRVVKNKTIIGLKFKKQDNCF